MSASTRPRSRPSRTRSSATLLQKPHGTIHPRVQAVGPEHFAIIAVDPAKARSKWMMIDFYGNVLIPPTVLEHHARGFREAIEAVNGQIKVGSIKYMVVVER